MLIKFIITGYCILIIAILANLFANIIGLCTWYDFFNDLLEKGIMRTILSTNFFQLIWLFLIYPTILAIGSFVGHILYSFIII